MLKQIVTAATLAISLVAFGVIPASAADEVIVEETTVTERSTYVEREAVDDGDLDGPRVYGWASERPLDCGAYHYWDGEDCVDARSVPPDTGPKW